MTGRHVREWGHWIPGEKSRADCSCRPDVRDRNCPVHYAAIYAAWHSKHRAT